MEALITDFSILFSIICCCFLGIECDLTSWIIWTNKTLVWHIFSNFYIFIKLHVFPFLSREYIDPSNYEFPFRNWIYVLKIGIYEWNLFCFPWIECNLITYMAIKCMTKSIIKSSRTIKSKVHTNTRICNSSFNTLTEFMN